mgnify:CR=1 FL=1
MKNLNWRQLKTTEQNNGNRSSFPTIKQKPAVIVTLTLGISMGLSGCSTYSSKFDCPYGTGMGCSSLSTVNKVIDANVLDRESDLKGLGGLENNTSTMIYFGSEVPSELVTFAKDEL